MSRISALGRKQKFELRHYLRRGRLAESRVAASACASTPQNLERIDIETQQALELFCDPCAEIKREDAEALAVALLL